MCVEHHIYGVNPRRIAGVIHHKYFKGGVEYEVIEETIRDLMTAERKLIELRTIYDVSPEHLEEIERWEEQTRRVIKRLDEIAKPHGVRGEEILKDFEEFFGNVYYAIKVTGQAE